MKTVTLNTGSQMPIIGSGTNTYGKENRDYQGKINFDTSELASAIAAGYRHFDTAISYRNEAVVGKAWQASGLPREDFFLTSKLPGRAEFTANEAAVVAGIEQSLTALATDYLDLYLIHHPWDNFAEMLNVWRVLESYVDQGKLKAIGVSNFDQSLLSALIKEARIQPAVNQIESHPGHWQHDLIAYCQSVGVVPEAWGPLSRVSESSRQTLSAIGANYSKTWAQVILAYQLDRGVVVIPKSHNAQRQADNLAVFDVNLTAAEKAIIAAL